MNMRIDHYLGHHPKAFVLAVVLAGSIVFMVSVALIDPAQLPELAEKSLGLTFLFFLAFAWTVQLIFKLYDLWDLKELNHTEHARLKTHVERWVSWLWCIVWLNLSASVLSAFAPLLWATEWGFATTVAFVIVPLLTLLVIPTVLREIYAVRHRAINDGKRKETREQVISLMGQRPDFSDDKGLKQQQRVRRARKSAN